MKLVDADRVGGDTASRRLRLLALASMALPLLVVAMVSVAEGVGREMGWWGHLLQLAALAGLTAWAWFRPRVGGPALLVGGVVLAGWMLWQVGGASDDGGAVNLPAVLLLLGPMAIAGGLFTAVGRREHGGGRP